MPEPEAERPREGAEGLSPLPSQRQIKDWLRELAKGSWELVEWAARIAECLSREPATPDQARDIMGLGAR